MKMIKNSKFQSILFALIAVFVLSIYSCSGDNTPPTNTEVSWGERPTDAEFAEKGNIIWETQSKSIGNNEYEVYIHAWLGKKWHTYPQVIDMEMGPLPTWLKFKLGNAFDTIGKAKEFDLITHYDPIWEDDLTFFESEALFMQKIKANNPDSLIFEGDVDFMMCDDAKCLQNLYSYKLDLTKGVGSTTVLQKEESPWIVSQIPNNTNTNLDEPINDCGTKKTEEGKTPWMLFIFGLLGGLVSLITPCVFPMIPLTVSFFTKGGKEKGKGIGRAIIYGISIVAVYVALSLPFYAPGTDPEMLNQISTGAPLNIFFFVVFVVFAISFFGYYEITLPSKWANKADSAADVGGFLGIVFMALVLAIVSFSCTGPLLGSVLAGSLKDGPFPITMAMLGFGVGLGLPFTIFAAFPSLLKSLPSSGGWLNTVKVVLGFVELGLAVKFLSNADFVYRAGIVHRETFFLIWAILAFATAAYLLGLYRFPHDSKNAKIGMGRKVIAVVFLIFGIYVAPGVMPQEKQPWNFSMVSGFPPSSWYSWYDQKDHLELETDYNKAMARAKAENKAVLIDFTGYACVNCRKMEENVWTDKKVHKSIDKGFIIASLYVDDKVALEKPGYIDVLASDGTTKSKHIKSIGDVWATFESLRFEQVSQPYYVLLHPDGTLLTNPVGYTPDSEEYLEWLNCGLEAFEKHEATSMK